MRTKIDADNCNETKLQLIEKIINANCNELRPDGKKDYNYIFLKANEPIPPLEAQNNKLLFEKNYKGQFKDSFTIRKDEINSIIGANWNKDFMHIFFLNDKDHSNELSLVFRFSKTETFNHSNLDDLTNDSAYWLLEDKTVKQFTPTDEKFSTLKIAFKTGIGAKISKVPHAELTEYVTFNMSEILSFRGFEQDATYELISKMEGYSLRIGLQVFIKDKDRVHHYDENGLAVDEGYYDLGNLKP